MSLYRWNLVEGDWQKAEQLAKALEVSRYLAYLLVARGYSDPESAYAFLHPSLDQLAEPFLLPDAEVAVRRLAKAIQSKETILVCGDYDADGLTATALWVRMLKRLKVEVHPYIPHRMREGYDFHQNAVAEAQRLGAALILTCDCGSKASEVVEYAQERGIEVVITDHHEPGAQLPPAVAVVNPHRADSAYPFPDLSGVGVAFRLGEALVRELGYPVQSYRNAFLDLVAIGTIADVMPLVGENRIFAFYGLKTLAATRKVGLQQLLQVAGISKETSLTPFHIGFIVGPRLNAAGRLSHAVAALELLLSEDAAHARLLAEQLNRQNRQRQDLQEQMIREAIAQIEAQNLTRHKAILVHSPHWHGGVIGIVAGRLVSLYSRPVFIVSRDEQAGIGKGSIRSLPTFDLRPLLDHLSPLCLKCGGHPLAGGFTVELDRLPAMEAALYAYAERHLSEEELVPQLLIEMELPAREVDPAFVTELEQLAPFGHGNEAPTLLCRSVTVLEARPTKDGKHLQLLFRAEGLPPTPGIAFGFGDQKEHLKPGTDLDLVFTPEWDTFRNEGTLRWRVKDFRLVEA